ncbi:dihydrolipoyl dehydrogenase [Candidatus Magnetominusculus xianensis]|uniref:Dihydrolipoyl dehydrogenase n=1 Tax=Candidatus Magnetominusculus xianensis TaxID=1748249 RepID=A0ABR5SFJ9_9BACT|nr:dihydrolipoyl dehydrogenase [Candidatus Magnetominusculus xianensis]KWT84048.1 pyridine nucleotide-disulfide oxidoreductase [Candidatus Magnetominusculus xianensis]MBF0402341.1 dihydrolipoyl dehydrogenase [Nitrospirota bacterium]
MKILILGSGPGGYVAALRAAQMGAEVTVVEEKEVGGTCLNEGCIPTKTLVASAEAYATAKDLASFGIDFSGEIKPNAKKIVDRKNSVIATQVKGIRGLFKSWGVTLKEGRGSFISEKEIRLIPKNGPEETLTADKFIIATGSRPASIPTFPFDGRRIISSTEALDMQEIPDSMLIIGAGVMGCEFGCIYREFGTEVTLIELMPRALTTEDPEISQVIERELKKKKIKLHLGVKVEKVTTDDTSVKAYLSGGKELSASKMLVTIGRAFNTNGVGLEHAGVEMDKRGAIIVNDSMETSNKDIYAIGDVTGGMLLAHVASKQGLCAVSNIMGHKEKMDYTVIPAGIFTHPEIASVGLREHQLAERGAKYKVGRFQYRALGKAHAMGEISGMFKVIADSDTNKILGVHIIGHNAADIIHEAAVAMKAGLTAEALAETVHAHPTLAEGLMEAAEDVMGRAVHVPKP